MLLPCPTCEVGRIMKFHSYTQHVTMKGQEVYFNAKSYRCCRCGEWLDTPETLDANLAVARAAYREKMDLENFDIIAKIHFWFKVSYKKIRAFLNSLKILGIYIC